MTRTALIMLCASLLGVCMASLAVIATTHPTYAQEANYETLSQSTHQLYRGDVPICSAVFVSSVENEEGEYVSHLLTAEHCVAGQDLNIRLQTRDKQLNVTKETIFYLKKIKSMKSEDVAYLRVIDTSHKFQTADVAPKGYIPALGQRTWVVGYPMSAMMVAEASITAGEFTGLVKTKSRVGEFNNLLRWRSTAPIAPGNSGGPLFAKIAGKYYIIGIASMRLRQADFMSMFARLPAIHVVLP